MELPKKADPERTAHTQTTKTTTSINKICNEIKAATPKSAVPTAPSYHMQQEMVYTIRKEGVPLFFNEKTMLECDDNTCHCFENGVKGFFPGDECEML